MKKTIFCLLFIVLLATVFSCRPKPMPALLLAADSLASANPDSALTLLARLEDSLHQAPEPVRMYYNLLTVKAQDKAYILHTSDSLIRTVVDYYEHKNNHTYLPEAYYYAGRVYRDLNDSPQALEYFQKAAEAAEGGTDYNLKIRIYSQMGMLYIDQDIYDKALEALKKAKKVSIQNNDSTALVFNLRDIGRTFAGLHNADSCIYYYESAIEITRLIHDKYLEGIVNQEIADKYRQIGEYTKAHTAIISAQHTLYTDSIPYYATLADYYNAIEQLDSARYYCNKLLYIGNYYHKRAGYEGLVKIARKERDYLSALQYMDGYNIYTDSIQQNINQEAVRKVNALYNYQLREKENRQLKELARKQQATLNAIILCALFIAIISTAILITRRAIRNKRKLQAAWQQEKLQKLAEEQYRTSQEYIRQNEKRIAELTRQLQDKEQQKSELSVRLQETDRELLELANREAEMKQKRCALSEQIFKESAIYQKFCLAANCADQEDSHKIISEDWQELTDAINQAYNNFTQRLRNLYPAISEQEMHLALLGKIGITPSGMARITVRSKQAITSARKALYEKVHKKPGTPKEWDEFIKDF